MISVEEAKEAARTLKQFCDEQKDCKDCFFRVEAEKGGYHCGTCYPANQDWLGVDDNGEPTS